MPPNHTIVRDDKIKKVCWIVPTDTFQAYPYQFVANNSKWEFVDMNHEEANITLQDRLRGQIPERLWKQLRVNDETYRLPHMYINIKSKC